ncbi:tetratricopeptide repeat protein [Pendulispora brunnea]|uniref:Tetratricopeptide repeat protein n=1 Tax=Pendulispora brunnea TaxID=2905690 RepID=A0ABZ2KJR4_9BACT
MRRFSSFSALVLLSVVWSIGCGPPQGARADEARQNVRTFKREQNPQRLYDYGRAFADAGDLTRAEQYFAAAIAAGGDERKILPRLVRVCVQDGRYQVAIHYVEDHLGQHPADHRSRFLLASLYLGVGDGVHARAHLEKVLTATPDDAEAHFALAVIMRDTHEDPVAADHHFREYLRLRPGGSHAEEAQSSLLKSVQ